MGPACHLNTQRDAGPAAQPDALPVRFHEARCTAGAVNRCPAHRLGRPIAAPPMARTAPGPSACGYDWVNRMLLTAAVTSPSSTSQTPLRVRPVMTRLFWSSTRVYQKSVISRPRRMPLTRARADAAVGPSPFSGDEASPPGPEARRRLDAIGPQER